MARKTSFAASTLSLGILENLSIDGRDYGGVTRFSIASIKDVTKRIVTVTTTEATILTFSSAIGAGTYIAADVMYMRFTNLDTTNHLVLTFKDEDNTEFKVKVDAEKSFLYLSDNSGGLVDTMKANGSALSSGLADLYDITADADTASCDLEIFIACK